MEIKHRLIYILLPVFLIAGCSQQGDKTYTEEVIEGIRYIHNHAPLWGDETKVELEFVMQIGDNESEDERYTFRSPSFVSEDRDRNIYIVQRYPNNRVKKYTSNGIYLNTFEVTVYDIGIDTGLESICIDNNGNLNVCISPPIAGMASELVTLDQTGKETNRITFEWKLTTEYFVLKNGNIVSEERRDSTLFSMHDKDGKFLFAFGKRRIYEDKSFTGHRNYFTIDKDDNIYMVYGSQNRLEKYNAEGKLLFNSDRKLDYEETIEGKIKYNRPDYNRFSRSIGVDYKGRIWTVTYLKQPDFEPGKESEGIRKLEIFNSEGILLGYTDVPDCFDFLFHIYQDHIYFTNIDTDCVYVYKIVEK